MKKITYTICSFVLIIFINSCVGYEPIFGSSNLKFEIIDYSIDGDKKLGNKIYTQLNNLSKSNKNEQNAKKLVIFINVNKNKNSTTKDSAGKILEYKITLSTKVELKDSNTLANILNETFVYSTTYKVQTQFSDTVNLENQSIDNLINKTYQELLVKMQVIL